MRLPCQNDHQNYYTTSAIQLKILQNKDYISVSMFSFTYIKLSGKREKGRMGVLGRKASIKQLIKAKAALAYQLNLVKT